MPNRDWRSKAELEAIVLEKLRGYRGCEGATSVVVEEVNDPRSTATWTVSQVLGSDPGSSYDDILAGLLPTCQAKYGLALPAR